MKLHELAPPKGAKKKRKRVGRGVASGTGKTAGRGTKGQNSRSGGKTVVGFEGGQMPLHRRLPKRGFTNIFKKTYHEVNIRDLARFEAGSTVDAQALIEAGLIKGRKDGVKILGHGEMDRVLTIKADKWTASAKEKIEKAGGTIEGS